MVPGSLLQGVARRVDRQVPYLWPTHGRLPHPYYYFIFQTLSNVSLEHWAPFLRKGIVYMVRYPHPVYFRSAQRKRRRGKVAVWSSTGSKTGHLEDYTVVMVRIYIRQNCEDALVPT